MHSIGKLSRTRDGDDTELTGTIDTIAMSLTVRLEKINGERRINDPAYRVLTPTRSGRSLQIGSAWEKVVRRGDNAGVVFLSITLDDPSFAQSLNVAAFLEPDGKSWAINWRRRQTKPNASE